MTSSHHRARVCIALASVGALAVGAASLTSACSALGCTLIGWDEGLTVEISSVEGFRDGSYELIAAADGVTLRTAFRVTDELVSCVDDCALRPDGADRGFGGRVDLLVSVDGLSLATLNVYRVADGDLAGGPRVLDLHVVRDGVELGARTFQPRYRREEINGRGCGVATRASGSLVIQ